MCHRCLLISESKPNTRADLGCTHQCTDLNYSSLFTHTSHFSTGYFPTAIQEDAHMSSYAGRPCTEATSTIHAYTSQKDTLHSLLETYKLASKHTQRWCMLSAGYVSIHHIAIESNIQLPYTSPMACSP